MGTPTFPELGGCGRPASGRIEIHSPAGSLAAVAYACSDHLVDFLGVLAVVGLTGHVDPDPTAARDMGRPCGHVFHYDRPGERFDPPEPTEADVAAFVARMRLPEPTSPAVTAVQVGEHPAWCARQANEDGTCEERGWHGSGVFDLEHPGETDQIEVELFGQFDDTTGRWVLNVMLRFTEDGETRTYMLGIDQAEVLTAVLVDLVTKARGGAQ